MNLENNVMRQKSSKTHTVHNSCVYLFIDRSCLWVDIYEVKIQKHAKIIQLQNGGRGRKRDRLIL